MEVLVTVRIPRPLAAVLAAGGVLLLSLSTATPGFAQREVPFRGTTPVAPSGIPAVPLPDAPVTYKTADQQDIRVVVVARGLATPWSLAFLPDGGMLVTERGGRLRLVRNGVVDPTPVAGVPEVRASGLSGLFDVTLHPRFAQNSFVYLSYIKPVDEKQTALAIARGRWTGGALADVTDVFVTPAGVGGPARMTFGRDGTLYVTTGAVGGNAAQELDSLAGKVLRLNDDGSVPADNPFVGRAGARAEIYTLGHRSSLGLAVHPDTGEVWQTENGPNGGDEINILKPGGNYGWPLVSLGRTYPGPWQSTVFSREGMENPVVYWTPSIATSGIAFYRGNALPNWKGDVFAGGMRTGEVPGTGHLERIVFNLDMEELRRESLLVDLRQRVRDVRVGPDELLYIVTDSPRDGAILRIEPAS